MYQLERDFSPRSTLARPLAATNNQPFSRPLMQNAKRKMQNKKWRKRMRHRATAAVVPSCILHFAF
ncbi:MAG TPA: hypothetical protein VFI31_26945 [Pirellulales bacterium]|nr:hypothetical protein [Pirellulales bacterium]